MLFPSVSFLFLFFPVFLAIFVLSPFKNLTILVFSLLFYTWGEGLYVMLLLSTVLINYLIGLKIHNSRGRADRSRSWLCLGVGANLLILFYFKYYGFILSSLMPSTGGEPDFPVLPLGISFYIFQSISYIADVYRKESPPAESFFDLALYITMFPQLIAGPIVRFSAIREAISKRSINLGWIKKGCFLFVGGLAQKILIANKAGQIADAAFGLPYGEVDAAVAWIGSTAYTLQIFFDFSGYTTMAMGIGMIMGFKFPKNFDYPYISTSVTEFWRRWHISLSRWFKDYLYIPLGGNQKGSFRTYANLVCVFILCGLWHGAAWTFLAWGLYHGFFLVLERLILLRYLKRVPGFISLVYTLLIVLIGWIIFRSENFLQARVFITALFSNSSGMLPPELVQVLTHENIVYCLLGILLSSPALPFLRNRLKTCFAPGRKKHGNKPIIGFIIYSSTLTVFIWCCIYIYAGVYNPFIYFRF